MGGMLRRSGRVGERLIDKDDCRFTIWATANKTALRSSASDYPNRSETCVYEARMCSTHSHLPCAVKQLERSASKPLEDVKLMGSSFGHVLHADITTWGRKSAIIADFDGGL